MQQFLPEKNDFSKLKANVAICCSSVVAFSGLIGQKYYTSSLKYIIFVL
jgi:hypothetical protein